MTASNEKQSVFRCRRFWIRIIGIVFLVFVLVMLGALRFGNTQWNRWIYIFQAYVTPGYGGGLIKPPVDYSGLWTQWHKNGQKLFEGDFKFGERDGKWTWWHPNGQKKGEVNYRNAVPYGKWIYWHKNGQIAVDENFKNGKYEGKQRSWFNNGQMESEGDYIDSNRDGKWTFLDKAGNIIKIEHYKNGKLIRTDKPKK